MTGVGIAVVAATAVLTVVVLVLSHAGRRARRESEDRVADALAIMGERMDALANDLQIALRRVGSEGDRSRAMRDLGHLQSLDDILARAVEAAATLPGVEAAVARTGVPDGTTVLAAIGMPDGAAEGEVFHGAPDGDSLRAVQVLYRRRADDDPPAGRSTRVAVPLPSGDTDMGFLAVYLHAPDADFSDLVADLEAIARAAATALLDAQARVDDTPAAAVDTLTGLLNRETFYETLMHEAVLAQRAGHPLSLLVLDLDDFRALNTEIGQLEGDVVLREVALRVGECASPQGVACRIGGDEFAVILPDAGRSAAEQLFASIQATLLRQPLDYAPSVTLSGGIAELAEDDDAVSLYYRAEAALQQAKATGKGTTA
jgi:diguanylate cyclase (GGDEF)-like protein